MADWRFEEHLRNPIGSKSVPAAGSIGLAGGAACGDLVKFGLTIADGQIEQIGFEAEGCGALTACASLICDEVSGVSISDAAKVSIKLVSSGLGELAPGKLHAAELTVDAFHRALGTAVLVASEDAAREWTTDSDAAALVAMSGGVDSAVVASMAGDNAVGITLELWRDADNDAESSCCSHSAVRRARDLAHGLGMPHLTVDLRDRFKAGVVDLWIEEHRQGVTPNPCVRCNGDVRLDAMLDIACFLGCASLHTGHYARKQDGLIQIAVDPAKDQSYMLCALQPESIARLEFPLGNLVKPEVRQIASDRQLSVAKQPDSQDLCFLAGTGAAQFLHKHGELPEKAGPIFDADTGKQLGEHRGAHLYTVGQRKGLGVAAGEPVYVVKTSAIENSVTIGRKEQLQTETVDLIDITLYRPIEQVTAVKLRYRQQPRSATLQTANAKLNADGQLGSAQIVLDQPLLRPAPGQTAMLLNDDLVVGHATIV